MVYLEHVSINIALWQKTVLPSEATRNGFIGLLTFFPSSSFWAVFSLVLYFATVSVTAGSMGRYLEPAEAAKVVQLRQDDT